GPRRRDPEPGLFSFQRPFSKDICVFRFGADACTGKNEMTPDWDKLEGTPEEKAAFIANWEADRAELQRRIKSGALGDQAEPLTEERQRMFRQAGGGARGDPRRLHHPRYFLTIAFRSRCSIRLARSTAGVKKGRAGLDRPPNSMTGAYSAATATTAVKSSAGF